MHEVRNFESWTETAHQQGSVTCMRSEYGDVLRNDRSPPLMRRSFQAYAVKETGADQIL